MKHFFKSSLKIYAFIFLIIGLPPISQAVVVSAVKGNRIILIFDTQYEKLNVGDLVYLKNSEALITTIKNDKAVARIKKGRFIKGEVLFHEENLNLIKEKKLNAEADIDLEAELEKEDSTSDLKNNYESTEITDFNLDPTLDVNAKDISIKEIEEQKDLDQNLILKKNYFKIGLLYRTIQNTIKSKQTDDTIPFQQEELVEQKGLNFGLAGLIEYPTSFFIFRGLLGFESLKVSGTAIRNSCANRSSTNCEVNVNYAFLAPQARFNITQGSYLFWAGGGLHIKQPLTKNSTSLQEKNIQLSTSIVGTFGVDIFISSRYIIPISFEYHISQNQSATVPTINQNVIQIGLAWQ